MKKKIFIFLALISFGLFNSTVVQAAKTGKADNCNTVGWECMTLNDAQYSNIINYKCKKNFCNSDDNPKYVCCEKKIVTPEIIIVATNDIVSCTGPDVVKIFNTCVVTNSLDGMMGLGLAATKFMLGMVGSIALLAFVWGGFQMIMAAGDMSKVKKGKDSIIAAVIGLVIVFTSYILVQFVMENLLGVK